MVGRSTFLRLQGHPHVPMESSKEAEKTPGRADGRSHEHRARLVGRHSGLHVTVSAGLCGERRAGLAETLYGTRRQTAHRHQELCMGVLLVLCNRYHRRQMCGEGALRRKLVPQFMSKSWAHPLSHDVQSGKETRPL